MVGALIAVEQSSKCEAFSAGGFLLTGGAEEGSRERRTCEIGARMPPLGNQPGKSRTITAKMLIETEETHLERAQGEKEFMGHD